MALSLYSDGTISVANGSSTVTGVGTAWATALVTGGLLIAPTGAMGIVAAVLSDTSLTLKRPWGGTSLVTSTYDIELRSAEAATAIWSNQTLAEIIARIEAGTFLDFDATGTLAERAAYDGAAKGFVYCETDVNPFLVSIKRSATSGDWSTRQPLRGSDGVGGLLNWRGIWVTATGYSANDGLAHNGASYRCSSAHTSGASTEPGIGASWTTVWDLIAAKGANGTNGTNGTNGSNGATGATGPAVGVNFTYSTTTTDSDPGSGVFRLNHATIASATAAYIDNNDAGGSAVTGWLDTFDDSTNAVRGTLVIRGVTNTAAFAVFDVTGAVVDGTGYRKLTLVHKASGGTFTNTNTFSMNFARAGDAGAGAVSSVNGLSGAITLPVPYICTSLAQLKALDTTKYTIAFLNLNKRRAVFEWKPGVNYSTLHTLDTLGGAFVKADAIASTAGGWVLMADWLSPKHFDAVGDDTADDYAALMAWHAVLMASDYGGLINGKFKSGTAIAWNWEARRVKGVTVIGRAANDDYINVTDTTTSPAMYWHCNSQAFFYGAFRDFGIRTNRAGVGFQIGQDDFADAWNQCVFNNVIVNNGATNTSNVSLRLNHILHSQLLFIANAGGSGNPGAGTAPGFGTAVQFRQVITCTGAPHAGNANVAHEYLGGYSYNNVWTGINIEEVDTAIKNTSANAFSNKYEGGNVVCKTLFNCTAGRQNLLEGVNVGQYAGYSIGTNLVGVEVRDFIQNAHVTDIPFATAFPSSGTLWTNNTTRAVIAAIKGGSVTNLRLHAPDTGLRDIVPQTAADCPQIKIPPGWGLTPTFTGSPTWTFVPA